MYETLYNHTIKAFSGEGKKSEEKYTEMSVKKILDNFEKLKELIELGWPTD